MDNFATLEPVRLHGKSKQQPRASLVGRLPSDIHILVLSFIEIPDYASYSRCSHATAALAHDESLWQSRYSALEIADHEHFPTLLDELENKAKGLATEQRSNAPPTINVDDDFGEFASVDVISAAPDEMGDFVGGFDAISMIPQASSLPSIPVSSTKTARSKYIRVHNILKPLTKVLTSPAHVILSSLSSISSSTRHQARVLHLLSLFLSSRIKPLRQWSALLLSLRSAMDRFDANLLAAFDMADSSGSEEGMNEAAEASWEIWDGKGEWEMGKVWAEKREIFYQQGAWNPDDNFSEGGTLAFNPMDNFMRAILSSIKEHGSRAARIFPSRSKVLIFFSQRLSSEVVGDYITSLLSRAREISHTTFLTATAATFRESWKIVDAIMAASKERADSVITHNMAEDVVFQMFEVNMDDYLDEEVESLKSSLDSICRGWDKQQATARTTETARFLSSHNPAQVKRNVLASFTDVLLLPVTIVPKTVGAVGGAIITGGSAAVQGIGMLNPQRWGGPGGSSAPNGYTRDGMVFEVGEDEDGDAYEESIQNGAAQTLDFSSPSVQPPDPAEASQIPLSVSTKELATAAADKMDLLLSLDIALELIHADREALKRTETFASYPGHYGHRVRDTIEEVFILLLQALGEGHIKKGFTQATEKMTSYKPAEHEETTSVAPLLQFFELVHIGDTIQSMVQVYFDKELANHIDRTDFLNAVVREKKRFENALDDSVAAGLNAGTDVLMNQVEHIILVTTKPREYCPPEDASLDLGPTKGCTEAIKCLDMHCKLLKGSTSKEVLEVFYQEVGIRLIVILQKHIKRQIISLTGGFQIIADLNAYHTFIASLKVPAITADFSYLKMLGHVYVVEDAKDLAQIVRDVTRYGGAYRPEDIYEFIQRRSDWKKIEKTVDKTMYNLSFKEDCIIS